MKTIGRLACLVAVLALAAPAFAGGACDHPYAPGGKGARWTYALKSKTGAKSKQYTITKESVTASGFMLRYAYPDVAFTVSFTCTAAGITSPRFGLDSATGKSGSVTYQVTASSGVILAPPATWTVGGTWAYSNQGTARASGTVYTFKSDYGFRVVARERARVPAGAYDALKVVLTQKGEFGSGGYVQPMNYTLTQWYARGVGIVRQEDQFAVHELLSYRL